jgi:hypothetical protein
MVTSLLLGLLVGTTPARAGLMTTSRVAVGDAETDAVEQAVSAALRKTGLEIQPWSSTCRGEVSCLQEQGRASGVDAVISLGLARGPTHVIIEVEVLSVRSGQVLGQQTWKWNQTLVDSLRAVTEPFAVEIGARVQRERLVAVAADAPLQPNLVPEVPLVSAPVVRPSRAPAIISTTGAGVAFAAAAVLTGLGVARQSELPPLGSSRPALSRGEAEQLARGANDARTGAAVAGVVAGGLAITALVLWMTSR